MLKTELRRSLPSSERFVFIGDNYPLSTSRAIVANLFTVAVLIVAIVGIFGSRMHFFPPEMRAFLTTNGSYLVGFSVFLFVLGGRIRQTGAFEVYVDDQLIFSKLSLGRAPSATELRQLILETSILRRKR